MRTLANCLVIGALLLLFSNLLEATAKEAKKSSNTKLASTQFQHYIPYPPMVHPVRIGIANRASRITAAVWEAGALFIDARPVYPLAPGMIYIIQGGRITEAATGRTFVLPEDRRAHLSSRDFRIWTNPHNRGYRGCMELISYGDKVTLINLLDMEDYLLGVVPSEMPASWHLEALKSQAVAARSYAWAHLGSGSKWYRSEGYDLVPDVRDQAYKGLAAEANSTFHAVQQTRGIILKDSGRVKPGFYRATVGDNAFENLNIRKARVKTSTLQQMTGVNDILGVTVKQWDINGNAHSVQVMGRSKTKEVYGVALAKMLNFSTAGILDVHEDGDSWEFTYRGPGNGARGLSQHGANMFAKSGWRFDQILQQYYQDPDGKLRLDYIDHYKAPTPVKHATKSSSEAATE